MPIKIPTASMVYIAEFNSWQKTLPKLLDGVGLVAALAGHKRVLIKPNLVEALAPPITTPVDMVAALVDYLQDRLPEIEIVIGEGAGARDYETKHSFEVLGYQNMAREKNVALADLNTSPLIRQRRSDCRRWPEMYLPRLVFDSFLLSVPVLKAHSLAGVTLTMKNMMGLVPPTHYQRGGHWKKASFHDRIQEAIHDLNCYRAADFSLLDATIGMQEAHLWGPTCNPPPNQLAASYDPVAIDAYGSLLLRRDWRQIGHIRLAHGKLGCADPLNIQSIGN